MAFLFTNNLMMEVIHMEENQLREYINIIWRRLWIIFLTTVLLVVGSGILSYFILEPEYETFTTFMLSKPNMRMGSNEAIGYNDIILNQKLVFTYGEIAKSRLVSSKVINNLGLNITPEELRKKVKVSLIEDTEIIKISVNHTVPELAAKIANETSKVFEENIVNMLKVENIQVIDKAEVPIKAVSPKPELNMLIAGILGIMTGMFLVFLLEFLDNTIKTPLDVEKHIGSTVIGMIPKSLEDRNPKSYVSEAYRTLRTNIQFISIDKNIQTLVVTSSVPGEGKSTVAANLAITMAQLDKKVLLIDADLRKPKIHKIFNKFNFSGLTTVLAEEHDYKAYVEVTDISNLEILTSGPIPPNPAELLGSNRMKDFLEKVKEDYDIILLDSPPVGIVTDAAILSTKCHGVLIVCAAGKVIIKAAVNTKKTLEKVNANIIGVVMNKILIKEKRYYYQSYSKSCCESEDIDPKKRKNQREEKINV